MLLENNRDFEELVHLIKWSGGKGNGLGARLSQLQQMRTGEASARRSVACSPRYRYRMGYDEGPVTIATARMQIEEKKHGVEKSVTPRTSKSEDSER